jgi:hypothetical protein
MIGVCFADGTQEEFWAEEIIREAAGDGTAVAGSGRRR